MQFLKDAITTVLGICLLPALPILALGWIPILVVAIAPDHVMGIGFWGRTAVWSTTAYLVAGTVCFVLWMTVPDRGQLPHGLKFLAFLFPHPADDMVSTSLATTAPVDGPALAQRLRDIPATLSDNQIRTYQARKMAQKAEAKTKTLESHTELAEAMTELERAKARVEALKKREE